MLGNLASTPYFCGLVNTRFCLTAMISLDIVGLREGNHPFTIESTAQDIPHLPAEYTGLVTVQGLLQKHGRRYTIDATATGQAHFTCDRSLEEFDEDISADLSLSYIVDPALAAEQAGKGQDLDEEVIRGIREEDKRIDITEDVRQVLAVAIPLRHVAPAYRDVPLEQLHPALAPKARAADDEPVDDRWAALKNLKRT